MAHAAGCLAACGPARLSDRSPQLRPQLRPPAAAPLLQVVKHLPGTQPRVHTVRDVAARGAAQARFMWAPPGREPREVGRA
jgi:hypothetical protein